MIGLAAPSSLIQKKSNFSGTLKRKRETRKCNTWQRIWFELTSEAINIQRQEEKLKDVQHAKGSNCVLFTHFCEGYPLIVLPNGYF